MDNELPTKMYAHGRVSLRRVFACCILIALTKAALTVFGYGKTLRTVVELVGQETTYSGIDWSIVDLDTQAVVTAAALYPGRALCLERALVLCACLRWHGFPALVKLGVQPFPFQAHAWVECAGQAVHEDPERLKPFQSFPSASS